MSAHVLLNLLNELGKRDKMRGLPSILSLFCNVPPQSLIQFYPESGYQNNKCNTVNIYGHGTNQQV